MKLRNSLFLFTVLFSCNSYSQKPEYELAFGTKTNRVDAIAISSLDGSSQKRLTFGSRSDSGPDWSYDGSKIVFHSERVGWWKIWVMNADGSEITKLTNTSSADYGPIWSGDNKKIYFTSGRTGNEDIYSMNPDGSNQKNITNRSGDQRYPRWDLKNGRLLYYEEKRSTMEVHTMMPDGTDDKLIELGGVNNYMADMSPDGKWIVFTSDRDGSHNLYIYSLITKKTIQLTDHPLIDYRAKWSNDGKYIAFERSNRKSDSNIFIIDPELKTLTKISKNGYNFGPAWIR